MKTVITMSAAEMNTSIKSIRKMAESIPFMDKLNEPELKNGYTKYGHEAFFVEEKIDAEGCILSITSKEDYTTDALLVMEDFVDTFGVEILATILKVAKIIKSGKGITSSKLKAFADRASSIMKKHEPFRSYAVIEVDWLSSLGVKAALVIENCGFDRRVVGIHQSGDSAALAFVKTKAGNMDLSTIGPFTFSDIAAANDAAIKIIDVEPQVKSYIGEKNEAEADKYVFNGVRGGMDINEDVDRIAAEFTVE